MVSVKLSQVTPSTQVLSPFVTPAAELFHETDEPVVELRLPEDGVAANEAMESKAVLTSNPASFDWLNGENFTVGPSRKNKYDVA
jgi:hypothetical protein